MYWLVEKNVKLSGVHCDQQVKLINEFPFPFHSNPIRGRIRADNPKTNG